MTVKISARHGHLSDAAHQLIEEKAGNLIHFFERLTMIEVTVDLGDHRLGVVEDLEHPLDVACQLGAPSGDVGRSFLRALLGLLLQVTLPFGRGHPLRPVRRDRMLVVVLMLVMMLMLMWRVLQSVYPE